VIKLALVVGAPVPVASGLPGCGVVLGSSSLRVYRAARTGSLLLPVLAVVDVAVTVQVWGEYRRLPAGSPR
jgi:uncharacterized membrane protein